MCNVVPVTRIDDSIKKQIFITKCMLYNKNASLKVWTKYDNDTKLCDLHSDSSAPQQNIPYTR